MRIHFANLCVPNRAAKRLKRLLSEKEAKAKQITSYVLGYRNWHELESSLGKDNLSRLDEDCSEDELRDRKDYQIQRLSEKSRELDLYFGKEKASIIWDEWRPSAANPHLQSTNPEQWDNTAEGKQFEALLVQMHSQEKVLPNDLLLVGVRKTNQDFLVASTCSIGEKLLAGSQDDIRFSKEIFELACARGNSTGAFELARYLATGVFGYQDIPRSITIFKKIVTTPNAPSAAVSYARVGIETLERNLDSWPINPKKALREWEAAAEQGDAEAAYRAAVASDPLKRTLCILGADTQRCVRYYRIAAKAGHVKAALNLSMQLTMHPDLEEYSLESADWQEFAEKKGDRGAKRIRAIIDEKIANLASESDDAIDPALEKIVSDLLPGSQYASKITSFPGYGNMLFIQPNYWLSLNSGVIIEDHNGGPPNLEYYFGNGGALRNEYPRPVTVLSPEYIREHFPEDETKIVERSVFAAHISEYVHGIINKKQK